MLKINNNNLITGYIKQMLSEFNLPKAKVLKRGMTIFKGGYYIYQKGLYRALETGTYGPDGDFNSVPDATNYLQKIDNYMYGEPYLNITKNLELKSSIYDSYTHTYLGDYLRFYRDYNNIDLMSMYNCFGGDVAHNIKLEKFNSEDGANVIYLVPVKFYKRYTIAVDCATVVEMSLCLYAANQLIQIKTGTGADANAVICNEGYDKTAGIRFNAPYVYKKLESFMDKTVLNKEKLYLHERDLRLMIKLPITNKSSLVVLEGDYEEAIEHGYSTSFSWDDNKDVNGNYALSPTENWYIFDEDAGEFVRVVNVNTNYFESGADEPAKALIKGHTYHIGSASSEDTITIGEEDKPYKPYYRFSGVKDRLNFCVNNTERPIKYYLSKDNFPVHPSKAIMNSILIDESTGLGYAWDADREQFISLTESSITSLPLYERNYNTRMQLLYVNDNNNYVFADKLIGYLIRHVITSDDNIWDNIRRLQKTYFYRKNPAKRPDYNPAVDKKQPIGLEYMPKTVGLWSQDLRDMTYDLLRETNVLSTAFDTIGFIDKDAEKILGSDLSYDKYGHIVSGGIR